MKPDYAVREGKTPGKRVLVTYATRMGSTTGIAEAIGRTLAAQGVAVDVRAMQEVHDLTPYSAVVAGSAIQAGCWLPEAMQFMEAHREELLSGFPPAQSAEALLPTDCASNAGARRRAASR